VVFQGYSQEISISSIDSFCFDYNSRGIWRYKIPTGQGEHIVLGISLEMIYGKNAARIVFFRHPADGKHCRLADSKKIKLILRPDIEDRNFHETIKAYQGPENSWPEAVTTYSQGFAFKSSTGNFLRIKILNGAFTSEPEWEYMVCHPGDAERGTDPESDLFSPGYFTTFLEGGQAAELYADIAGTDKEKSSAEFTIKNPSLMFNYDTSPDISRALKSALNHYVVKHENLKTVIAGYPWFLDWGRDALIFTRGLIAAGQTKAALDILQRFSLLEKGGTLPNMIRGGSAENRDTSDAPLWFFVACSDFINVEKNPDLLDMRPKDRSIRETLVSIGLSLIAGTFNGIRMDRESALIFSPSHFTWMDTDNPAGTPREGYPVEIQALWYFALCFLARIDDRKTREYNWEKLAERVCSSIHQLYWIEEKGYLSDCLHASSGTPALQADRDDALRPNQLFAVTLEAVKNREVIMKIMEACEELLIPGAVRSLADRPVKYPVEITLNGKMINDPYNPYHGEYTGDEDTRRKPAYHNGTAWTWLLPIFCEAWIDAYGRAAKNTALAMLGSSAGLINRGCAGHVPEILDGNFPHTRRGCDAQAWGASELLRVWEKLKAL
jgi:predicted glycogen debranching enzyme